MNEYKASGAVITDDLSSADAIVGRTCISAYVVVNNIVDMLH